MKNTDPTQPNPWVDPTHVHLHEERWTIARTLDDWLVSGQCGGEVEAELSLTAIGKKWHDPMNYETGTFRQVN